MNRSDEALNALLKRKFKAYNPLNGEHNSIFSVTHFAMAFLDFEIIGECLTGRGVAQQVREAEASDSTRSHQVLFTFSSDYCSDCALRPESLEFVRKKAFESYHIVPHPRRKYFVYRSSPLRAALNIEQAKQVAIEQGFELIETHSLSFEEQVRLFSEACCVFFQSGAAFANILFAPASCSISIALVGSENINYSLFQFLPEYLGMRAKYLLCEGVTSSDWRPWHRSYTIDLCALEKALKDLSQNA